VDEAKARSIITMQLNDVATQRAQLQSEAAPTGPPDEDVGDDVDTSQRLQAQNENSALIAGLDASGFTWRMRWPAWTPAITEPVRFAARTSKTNGLR
jgi:hypothetical protein